MYIGVVARNKEAEKMPYIGGVIDELASLMQADPRGVEAAIVRLCQMSRAVGIHLIVSTMRTSPNILTGLILANIPARIGFQMASQVDSRVLLYRGGAEMLLGEGDMLYMLDDEIDPVRGQALLITAMEVAKTVQDLKREYKEFRKEEVVDDRSQYFIDTPDSDYLFEDVKKIVLNQEKVSTAFLQRKFHIGYARAARLMDMLEEQGIVEKNKRAGQYAVIKQ